MYYDFSLSISDLNFRKQNAKYLLLDYFLCCKSFMKMDKVDRVNNEEEKIHLIVTMTMTMIMTMNMVTTINET